MAKTVVEPVEPANDFTAPFELELPRLKAWMSFVETWVAPEFEMLERELGTELEVFVVDPDVRCKLNLAVMTACDLIRAAALVDLTNLQVPFRLPSDTAIPAAEE
jgi:hypothetical protein